MKDVLLKVIKSQYFWILVLAILGFLFGRHTAPTKIVEKEKVVERVVKEKDTSKEKTSSKRERKIVIKITRPDGTIEERTEIVTEDDKYVTVDIKEKESSEKIVEKEKTVDKVKTQWRISALAGIDLSSSSLKSFNISEYGASIERRIIGPIHAGVWMTSRPVAGVSLGIEF